MLSELKAGMAEIAVPVYSHVRYDVVDERQMLVMPDVVIVEGLNVLQNVAGAELQVADFFDFTVYVDADEDDIRRWFRERYDALRRTVFTDPASYFHRFADIDDEQAAAYATFIWDHINGPNLREHILPTRGRAHLVLEKGPDHGVRAIHLRRR
jgi:type I pantothenate kinase